MKIIKQYFIFEDPFPPTREKGIELLKLIERAGRTCYKSDDYITDISYEKFIKNIIARGHESVLEHGKISIRIITDRGVSHEFVRHRLASFSQESTRYCNYSKDKFGNEITVISPASAFDWDTLTNRCYAIWEESCKQAERNYFELLEYGASPQEARGVLPNSLKTEFVVTANIREWRLFFRLRTSDAAHPQMKELAREILKEFRKIIPIVFDDVGQTE